MPNLKFWLIGFLLPFCSCSWAASLELPESLCTPFTWAQAGPNADRAALLIKAVAGNQTLQLQLDTGSDVSGVFNKDGFRNLSTQPQSIQLGMITLSKKTLVFFETIAPGQADGILGLDSLRGKRFVIDYPQQLFCLAPTGVINDKSSHWLFIPARLRSGKLFLFSTIGQHSEWAYFFDTGASLYHLLIDKNHWQALTSKRNRNTTKNIITGAGWGKTLTTVGAPIEDIFALGAFTVNNPQAHYIKEQPDKFYRYPFATKGLIGNAPFYDHIILMDLRSDNIKFGIYRNPDVLNTQ